MGRGRLVSSPCIDVTRETPSVLSSSFPSAKVYLCALKAYAVDGLPVLESLAVVRSAALIDFKDIPLLRL